MNMENKKKSKIVNEMRCVPPPSPPRMPFTIVRIRKKKELIFLPNLALFLPALFESELIDKD